MTTKERILEMLEQKRGRSVSGQRMANKIGVSRSAVWKAIKELQDSGQSIMAAPNRGYILCADSDALTEENVRPYLTKAIETVVVQPLMDSTNTRAKQLAAQKGVHTALVVANAQSDGRGRRGRSFVSPPGTGLYLSVLLRPALEMRDVVHVTCAAAVAVCRAVKKVCHVQLDIKWVNDLYRSGKKCGGILTEAVSDVESGSVEYIVVGIGLNLHEPANGFAPDIADIATAVLQPGETCWRGRLAATIANELVALVNALPATRFMTTYRSRNIVPGKDITILQNGTERPAHALAVTQEGHLLVRTEAGEEELSFGEVSIRLPRPETTQEAQEA